MTTDTIINKLSEKVVENFQVKRVDQKLRQTKEKEKEYVKKPARNNLRSLMVF